MGGKHFTLVVVCVLALAIAALGQNQQGQGQGQDQQAPGQGGTFSFPDANYMNWGAFGGSVSPRGMGDLGDFGLNASGPSQGGGGGISDMSPYIITARDFIPPVWAGAGPPSANTGRMLMGVTAVLSHLANKVLCPAPISCFGLGGLDLPADLPLGLTPGPQLPGASEFFNDDDLVFGASSKTDKATGRFTTFREQEEFRAKVGGGRGRILGADPSGAIDPMPYIQSQAEGMPPGARIRFQLDNVDPAQAFTPGSLFYNSVSSQELRMLRAGWGTQYGYHNVSFYNWTSVVGRPW